MKSTQEDAASINQLLSLANTDMRLSKANNDGGVEMSEKAQEHLMRWANGDSRTDQEREHEQGVKALVNLAGREVPEEDHDNELTRLMRKQMKG